MHYLRTYSVDLFEVSDESTTFIVCAAYEVRQAIAYSHHCNLVDYVLLHPDRFRIVALAARANDEILAEQCLRFRPAPCSHAGRDCGCKAHRATGRGGLQHPCPCWTGGIADGRDAAGGGTRDGRHRRVRPASCRRACVPRRPPRGAGAVAGRVSQRTAGARQGRALYSCGPEPRTRTPSCLFLVRLRIATFQTRLRRSPFSLLGSVVSRGRAVGGARGRGDYFLSDGDRLDPKEPRAIARINATPGS